MDRWHFHILFFYTFGFMKNGGKWKDNLRLSSFSKWFYFLFTLTYHWGIFPNFILLSFAFKITPNALKFIDSFVFFRMRSGVKKFWLEIWINRKRFFERFYFCCSFFYILSVESLCYPKISLVLLFVYKLHQYFCLFCLFNIFFLFFFFNISS